MSAPFSPPMFSGITLRKFIPCFINRDCGQLDIKIPDIQAKDQLEQAVHKLMMRDLLVVSCKYSEVKKFLQESKKDIEYENILYKTKVHDK